MKKPFLNLAVLLSTSILLFSSCQPPAPGANQPPVQGYVIIHQPCVSVHKLAPNSFQEVDFDVSIDVITLDANQNPVFFGPAITDSRSSSSSQPGIPYKTYDFVCPQETAFWSMVIEIQTTSCGYPTPNNTNGKIKYKALSPTLPIPVSYVAPAGAFAVRSVTGC